MTNQISGENTSNNNHEAVVAEAKEFLRMISDTQEVVDLARAFGADEGQLDGSLEGLKSFSSEAWDFRNGKERQQTEGVEFEAPIADAIFVAARRWHMVESSEPSRDGYDYATVPGGANMSPLIRVRYLKKQIALHGLNVPNIVLLGSSRKLSGSEKQKTSGYAPGAVDEFDLMNGAVEHEFGISHTDEKIIDLHNFSPRATEKDMWRVRYYETADGVRILSVSAPQIEGERRVNTADTYRFMREVIGLEELQGKSILNVTNAHFVPFQHADALRLLGLQADAHVETIGFSADYAGIKRKPHELLQEMNSAIKQATLLEKELYSSN